MDLDIEKLKKKSAIRITDYAEEHLQAFQDLPNLRKLEIDGSNLKSLDGIAALKNLSALKLIRCNHLESISGIESLADTLDTLQITTGSLTDFSPIGHLKNLRSLCLSNLDCIESLSFLEALKQLEDLKLYAIKKCDSLRYINALVNLENIGVIPWYVSVDDKSFLPLTQQLVRIGKLDQIIEWEEVQDHLDEEGMKVYKAHFGGTELQFIKRQFKFHCYEDYSEPYTKENCDSVDGIVFKLIEKLEEHANKDETEKLEFFKEAVLALNQMDDDIDGFISTGEREFLCDTFDEIAEAASLELGQSEGNAISKWRTW